MDARTNSKNLIKPNTFVITFYIINIKSAIGRLFGTALEICKISLAGT